MLVCIAAASAPFGTLLLPPGAELLAPTALFISALALFATAAVLAALYARTPRRSTAFLAGTYVATAIVCTLQAVTIPAGPNAAAIVRAAPAVSPWLYLLWHVGFCVCAALFFIIRWRPGPPLRAIDERRTVLLSFAAFAVAAAAAGALTISLGARLPRVLGGPDAVSPFISTGIGPALFAVCFLCCVVALSWRDADEIDAALSLSVVAFSLDLGLHLVSDHRFVVAWYAARLFALVGSSLVLVAAIRGLLAWRDRAVRLESLLAEEKRVAERHARRLEMLWRVGASTAGDDVFLGELLEAAAPVIVEGERLYGLLAHLDGAEMVVDYARDDGNPYVAITGGRYPIDESILGIVMREGKTSSWMDIRLDRRFDAARLQRVPWRSTIGTTFRVADTIYYVGFAGARPLDAPFGQLDHAFVETLASFCASRLQQRAQVDRLRYQTEHDALTGVLSRATFRARVFAALGAGEPAALAILDVDRFRELNEAIGHLEADAMLAEIANALRENVASRDAVGRLGGDAFGVLMPFPGSRDDVRERAERFIEIFDRPFGDGNGRAGRRIRASLGIAIAPDDGTAFEQLLARADVAVHAAKAAGGARFTFFEPRLEDAFAQERRLQNELAEALVRGEFALHFQPHIEFATGGIVGAEALIRWNHPQRGVLAPIEFVPFAEAHGMMGAIGGWVMGETVRASAAWRAADPDFRVWFNMSAAELADPALFERLRALEGARGVGIEITETVAMRDVHETLRNVGLLRSAGFAIALDDFGTGYSSLAHLKRLPIDVVKIDRAFTSGVPGDAHDEAIVGAVLEIANRFGFSAIAEGVESTAQMAWLSGAGCRFGQGYLHARPMTAGDFDAWLAQRRNTATGRAYMRA